MQEFTIAGEPVGKGRPRMARSGHVYTPAKTKKYEELVAIRYKDTSKGYYGKDTPVCMSITAYFGMPKSWSKKKRIEMACEPCLKSPDLDNICKAICDALNGIAYDDDKQIVSLYIEKYWGSVPSVRVRLWEMCENEYVREMFKRSGFCGDGTAGRHSVYDAVSRMYPEDR